jgi:hypothetical protein
MPDERGRDDQHRLSIGMRVLGVDAYRKGPRKGWIGVELALSIHRDLQSGRVLAEKSAPELGQ